MNESLRNAELKEGCAAKDLGAGANVKEGRESVLLFL